MKGYFLLLFIMFTAAGGYAQNIPQDADTAYQVNLKEIQVKARWKNDTDRYHYNQMKHYVIIVLPYVNAATKVFKEVNAAAEDENIGRRERRAFINKKEEEMRTQFEDKVKGLNTTQGVLLVKLIARQTDVNIYDILKEFKNPLTAIKWQAWARLNGMNLDKKYHPEEENDLENIMEELGYPLPQSYAMSGK